MGERPWELGMNESLVRRVWVRRVWVRSRERWGALAVVALTLIGASAVSAQAPPERLPEVAPDRAAEPVPPMREPGEPEGTGWMGVASRQVGLLVVDGRSTDRTTPVRRLELDAGEHRVWIVYADGRRSDVKTVRIRDGVNTNVFFRGVEEGPPAGDVAERPDARARAAAATSARTVQDLVEALVLARTGEALADAVRAVAAAPADAGVADALALLIEGHVNAAEEFRHYEFSFPWLETLVDDATRGGALEASGAAVALLALHSELTGMFDRGAAISISREVAMARQGVADGLDMVLEAATVRADASSDSDRVDGLSALVSGVANGIRGTGVEEHPRQPRPLHMSTLAAAIDALVDVFVDGDVSPEARLTAATQLVRGYGLIGESVARLDEALQAERSTQRRRPRGGTRLTREIAEFHEAAGTLTAPLDWPVVVIESTDSTDSDSVTGASPELYDAAIAVLEAACDAESALARLDALASGGGAVADGSGATPGTNFGAGTACAAWSLHRPGGELALAREAAAQAKRRRTAVSGGVAIVVAGVVAWWVRRRRS